MPTLFGEVSLSQEKALAILPKFSALCSLCGSLYIIYDVARMPYPMRKLYHRLMLGMSIFDCLSSTALFFTTWPIPSDSFPIFGAAGTPQTCAAQGFFVHLSISTILYNGSLAWYFYLVIRRGWKDVHLITSKVEYWFHSIPVLFGIGTSSAAAGLGLFNPNRWDCWIAEKPVDCDGEKCGQEGENVFLYQWLFFFIPLLITIVMVATLMATIVQFFLQQERNNDRWGQIPSTPTEERRPSTFGIESAASSVMSAVNSAIGKKSTNSMGSGSDFSCNSSVQRKSSQRANEIMGQSICYIGSFLIVWTFPTILRIHEITADNVHFHWVVLSALFWPCQGSFNFLVYMRPRYLKVMNERKRRREQMIALLREIDLDPLNPGDETSYHYGKDQDELQQSMDALQRSMQDANATRSRDNGNLQHMKDKSDIQDENQLPRPPMSVDDPLAVSNMCESPQQPATVQDQINLLNPLDASRSDEIVSPLVGSAQASWSHEEVKEQDDSYLSTPYHIRRPNPVSDLSSDLKLGGSLQETTRKGKSYLPKPLHLKGKAMGGSLQDSATTKHPAVGKQLSRPKSIDKRSRSAPLGNSSMGHSLGNNSSRRRETKANTQDDTATACFSGTGTGTGQTQTRSNARDNTVSAWLSSAGRRSLPRNLTRVGSGNARGQFSRINSTSGNRPLVASMTRANSAASRVSTGNTRHGWLTIAGVRDFAEDIATAMKVGDRGLGSALVGSSSFIDDDPSEESGAAIPSFRPRVESKDGRDFDT